MLMRRPRSFLVLLAIALGGSAGCGAKKTDTNHHADASVGPPPSADGGVAVEAGGEGDAAPSLTRAALLEAVGTCALVTAREAAAVAVELEAAVKDYEMRPEARATARAAFAKAMDAWQVADAMQFGPAARKGLPGGAGMRDFIYAWPSTHRCSVEEVLVASGWKAPDFLASALVNRRGFGALEYLLFYEAAEGGCSASAALAMLTPDERDLRKRAYAALLATDLRARIAALVDAWDPAKENFVQTLATAGPGNAVYPTSQLAFNAVGDALFYVEREVKDLKLAPPLGLRPECMNMTCPELLESQFGGRSKANVRANLVAFRRLIDGCGADFSGIGFNDLLAALNAAPVADMMRARVIAAVTALDAIEEPDFKEALAKDYASVKAVFDAIKALTDLLKTQFRDLLNIEIPKGLETDND